MYIYYRFLKGKFFLCEPPCLNLKGKKVWSLMTVVITLFLVSFLWCFEFTSKLKQQRKQEK